MLKEKKKLLHVCCKKCMYVCVWVGFYFLLLFVCFFVFVGHVPQSWPLTFGFYFLLLFIFLLFSLVTRSPNSHVTNYSRYLYLAFWHSHHWVFGLVFQSFSTLKFPFWSLHVFGPSWFSSCFVLLLAVWAMFSWHV